MTFDFSEHPHRRYNPLLDEWVLVSPHRTRRPWQGSRERPITEVRPRYDPDCYLCPGNVRANGDRNPPYDATFVFVNDFAAVLPVTPELPASLGPLFRSQSVRGEARVLCFSPRHDLTLAEMSLPDIGQVIELWAQQTEELGERFSWVQVFENRGAMMGASNPHPHGQIWATDSLGTIPAREGRQQRDYQERFGGSLLLDYALQERARRERTVVENDSWLVAAPFWAVWPFETLLLPKFPARRLPDLDPLQRLELAQILKILLVKYDNLFQVSFSLFHGLAWRSLQWGR